MARLRQRELWRPARDLPFISLCVAVAAALVRSVSQPDVEVSLGGTELALVFTDFAVAVLAAFSVARLLGRGSLPRPARAITAASAAFFGWLLLSSAANGADAFVGGLKLLEYGVLALGAVLFVQRRAQLWLLFGVIVAVNGVAVLAVADDVVRDPGGRQGSFLGAHDLAALSTLSLTLALASLYGRGSRLGRLPLVAAAIGAAGVIVGAALASLLGLYVGIAAIVVLAAVRGAVTRRALALTALAAVVVTAGVLGFRSGELGFVTEVAGSDGESGSTAGSWSQRLIYAYVGGRVFLDNPLLGTGWYGELPPEEFARFVPDARRRFSDQPAHYFPREDVDFIPQQTYDQVLFELGLVGAALFLVLAVTVVRTAAAVGRRWPHEGPDEELAYVPAAWTASIAGALAGAALFGGIPLTGLFWLTLGVVALTPSLVPPARIEPPAPVRREPALR
jgi:hypothetical protein